MGKIGNMFVRIHCQAYRWWLSQTFRGDHKFIQLNQLCVQGDPAMLTSHTIVRSLLACCLVVALLLVQTTAPAATLGIQYTGLNVSYDGSTITEVGNPDPLTSLILSIDGTQVGPPLTSGLGIDLSIPGVSGLPAAGGSTMSAAGGTLGLTLPGGDFLNLDLGAAEVIFVSITDGFSLQFVLGASEANVVSQSLPLDDGYFGDSVAISFSTQVKSGSLTQSNGIVTGFLASGTGEVEGNLVPEPTTVALLISGLLGCLAFIRRRA
jgi:hypothetical protein